MGTLSESLVFQDNRFMFNRGHWKNLKIDDSGPKVGSLSKTQTLLRLWAMPTKKTFTTDFFNGPDTGVY